MKGVILAGGTGSRLYPLTKITNKHLLPIGKYPMIYHPINKLVECGIHDILIVTGVEHMGDVVRLLGSGQEFSANFTYKVQDKPGGIAQALSLAESYVQDDLSIVLLGDNIFEDSLNQYVNEFIQQGEGAKILLKSVDNPERFGVAEVSGNQIVSIEEKPKFPRSSLCVTGIYMFDSKVFSFINQLAPSVRGEYEITDVNNMYIKNKEMSFNTLKGWWTDAGTIASLMRANQYAVHTEFENMLQGESL
ncbi:NTP transferase domain-containing protein [Hazenella sp. IB182357]|uniref:Glucose-1-phosphate thymidylyltransferase n=1 Tax=Polycladospora coralii TaxID=2771432 RepID=A0A926N8Z8_9BACL|nr:sugar phosphate nucleotidyltransferase [Polycladospora coralii]MBD1371577.1 NTP transferase domain-containing protein [Polycladospora coralii]MBS7529045.1 NTP transferase domain-containing protein [Polycladospora coralii]